MKKENLNTPGKYRKLYIGLSIGAGALLVALVLFVLVFNKFSLRLELHGPEKMTIRYGESYEEMGATPLFSGTIIYPQGYETESRVEISSNLDVHKAGTYEITYTATHMLWSAQAKRTVTVIDDIPPEITLLGDSRDRTLTAAATMKRASGPTTSMTAISPIWWFVRKKMAKSTTGSPTPPAIRRKPSGKSSIWIPICPS